MPTDKRTLMYQCRNEQKGTKHMLFYLNGSKCQPKPDMHFMQL